MKIRGSGKLGEKGREYVLQILLIGAAKVEIKISHGGLSGLAHGFHVFDDGGTETTSVTSYRIF